MVQKLTHLGVAAARRAGPGVGCRLAGGFDQSAAPRPPRRAARAGFRRRPCAAPFPSARSRALAAPAALLPGTHKVVYDRLSANEYDLFLLEGGQETRLTSTDPRRVVAAPGPGRSAHCVRLTVSGAAQIHVRSLEWRCRAAAHQPG